MFNTLMLIPLITNLVTMQPALAAPAVVETNFLKNTAVEILLDVPYVNQKEDLIGTPDEWAGGSACGPAALTMAFNDHGESYDLFTVHNTLPSNVYIKGNMFYDLAAGPEVFGYESNTIEINTTEIYNTLSEGHPIIMNVQNFDGIVGHAIVVVGIKDYNSGTESASALIAHDPFYEGFRTFEYINEHTLKQPEGWVLPIGTVKPFYVTKHGI